MLRTRYFVVWLLVILNGFWCQAMSQEVVLWISVSIITLMGLVVSARKLHGSRQNRSNVNMYIEIVKTLC